MMKKFRQNERHHKNFEDTRWLSTPLEGTVNKENMDKVLKTGIYRGTWRQRARGAHRGGILTSHVNMMSFSQMSPLMRQLHCMTVAR